MGRLGINVTWQDIATYIGLLIQLYRIAAFLYNFNEMHYMYSCIQLVFNYFENGHNFKYEDNI